MEGVRVKISEKYKPPKRISLPQRISNNEAYLAQSVHYDFNLERNILDKMKELRAARTSLHEGRKGRIDLLKQSRHSDQNEIDWKSIKNNNDTEVIKTLLKTDIPSTDNVTFPNVNDIPDMDISSNSTILQPTRAFASNHITNAAILTPIQTSGSSIYQKGNRSNTTSINISDFENDTSSPFDNMELKTLNDFEELAQVLQPEVDINKSTAYTKESSSNYTQSSCNYSHVQPPNYANTFNNYTPVENVNSNIKPLQSSSDAVYIPKYRPVNGFYLYTAIQQNNPSYIFNTPPNDNFQLASYPKRIFSDQISQIYLQDNDKTKSRSVPDIIQAVKNELPKESESSLAHGSKIVKKVERDLSICSEQDILPNPYNSLNGKLQQIVKEVSQMGFPLARVARASQVIGDDQTKIVEHMIAMSELLDVGFSEEKVAEALLKYNNDKDKALDFLIS